MNLMSLIRKHHLPILKVSVVIVVMEGGGSRATSTNGSIWLNSAAEVPLLTVIFEE
jgi:hypothetical protein